MPPPVRAKLLALGFSLVLALALAPASMAEENNGGLAPVDPASPGAERISDIYWFITFFAVAIFVIVTGSLLLFLVRFRSRGRPREVEGPQIRGNTSLELAWTALPVLILVAIAGFVFYKLPGIDNPSPAGATAGDELEITVKGYRFYWQYEYPNGVLALDHLRLPRDRTVEAVVTAADVEVNHSWWVPALAGKADAIPGEENRMRLRPTRTGTFRGYCAELCGIQHAAMLASVEVMEREEFDRWLAAQAEAQEAGRSDLGAMTWQAACAKCHGDEAQGLVGPTLQGNPLLGDRDGLEELIRAGQGDMPPVGPDWSEQQMDALARYVERRFGQQGDTDGG